MAKKKEVPESGDKALEMAVQSIRKHWGVDSLHVPGEEITHEVESISSGIPRLNEILGNGGFAKGAIIEMFGPEGSGKSTICLQIIAEAQKNGIKTLFIDQEHALDIGYAESIGVCVGDMYIAQPNSLEQALGIAEEMIKSGQIGLVVIDSLASLVPVAEVEKSVEEQTMGIQPRLLSTWLRRQNPNIADSGTVLIFTNQLRDKIGGYGGGSTTPGGRAVKFYSTYRLEIRVIQKLQDPKTNAYIGNHLRITTVKNKKAFPFQYCDVKLMYGEGIDVLESMVEDATGMGILLKSGNWYTFNPEVPLVVEEFTPDELRDLKFNGARQLKEFLVENRGVLEALETKVDEYKSGAWV